MNLPDTGQKRIVIIGGGFAGISLAKNLKGVDLQVVLIDRHNYHTFQPLLYQVSTSGLEPDSIAYPLRKVLKELDNFYFRMASVQRIDPDGKTVFTDIGNLGYDYLVLATGTKTNFFGNQNIARYAMPMKTVPQALDIRSLMLQNFEKADDCLDPVERKALLNFCIVGAGPTGVELAGAFAELKNNVFPKDYRHLNIDEMEINLFEGGPRVLPPMSENASKKATEFLKALGVRVHLNVIASDYDGERLTLKDGTTLNTKNFIWTAGVTGAAIEGFATHVLVERLNRYKVNRFNQVEGYDTVFAIGDIAYMETDGFPKGHPQVAQPAIQQGELLADNLERMLEGKELKPFTYRDKGTMATIGRNKAVADIKKLKFAGFFAWFIWMFVHLMALVGFRNKVVVFFNWAYNYINYDKAARLIMRRFRPKA
ncbi:NAD(P)/FAD-dependent oxidoreductase [Zobellia galactanivorans]|uniref:NADH:ubiquinone reductase (non-electrogenic) n=1 Tax=Zobellia galactanivorans (strain DSM 12802 / CCUG 47099 / CIP 106680 / NCIMB 13871 / Dsij) TaxID=63186 RepID=G0LBS7_ZOBGA|nr:NAD(P)/FAD-dependent oxidoreductase [Zobellia galactanivorans]MBU3026203.1 NAD(P)/FAD-dependent oxidoreductase [Zobellia galactanivorans]CAZ96419.1 FAD-dependent pyridine nucleotide-disulphide oxidoreductase, membrane [Zobellia galactanivorans]